ncbi:hypothetical protein RFI_06186 [Reticulomyxa filosa]|uniref:Uncharacterized protein n=1 Tax=Reticulomyxa filosa TaxID=46433 RepID=X6NY95_RETFI|nr:hypothetical protein RFI_06186 [Reticulomyxa filosa]|eukprot:ETO30936.1 hypothetical protein RFI_06186 [Reticulomyxa filosa]
MFVLLSNCLCNIGMLFCFGQQSSQIFVCASNPMFSAEVEKRCKEVVKSAIKKFRKEQMTQDIKVGQDISQHLFDKLRYDQKLRKLHPRKVRAVTVGDSWQPIYGNQYMTIKSVTLTKETNRKTKDKSKPNQIMFFFFLLLKKVCFVFADMIASNQKKVMHKFAVLCMHISIVQKI